MKGFWLIVAFGGALAPPLALACRSREPAPESLEARASLLFEGRAVGYEVVSSGRDRGSKRRVALVTFDVLKTMRGPHRPQWKVVYAGSINDTPPASLADFRWRFGEISKVGTREHTSSESRGLLVDAPAEFRSLPVLLQQECQEPFVRVVTPLTSVCLGAVVTEEANPARARAIEEHVRIRLEEVRGCFVAHVKGQANVRYHAALRLTIGSDGKASNVVVHDAFAPLATETCLKRVAETWLFSRLAGGGQVRVHLPFTFACE